MLSYAELTPPERLLWDAFATGERVDLRTGDPASDDPAGGERWGEDRSVRAEVVRALVLGGAEARPGETPVVHLVGARITGRLKLVFAEACCVLRLERCWFELRPQLYAARLRATGFAGSHLPGLGANRITVEGGNLDLMHTRITAPGATLYDARLDGALLLQDAQLSNPGGVALDGARMEVGSGIVGDDGFRAEGEVRLPEAQLGEALVLTGARLVSPGRAALTCRNLRARVLDLRAERVTGTVDLRHARVDVLHLPDADPPKAPTHVDGLVYGALEPHLPAARRLALPRHDPDGYRPQPYQQLAATYQSLGHDHEARAVRLAQQRHRRTTLRPAARAWGHLLDATVGYGYRPWLAGAWLALLTLLGAAAFAAGEPTAAKPDEAAPFNPLVYTLDLLIPIAGLGLRNAWHFTTPPLQGLAYALVGAGWLLTTALVAGVTRVLNRG